MSCCQQSDSRPGFSSPTEAFLNGTREKILYVTCIQPNGEEEQKADYLAVVDVDPSSATYCQVINRCYVPNFGDELHHMGWNTCSSCYSKPGAVRNKLVLPCLKSDTVYIIDTSDEKNPKVSQSINGKDIRSKCDVSAVHTSHCLPSGDLMISCMGDSEGKAKGSFLLLKPDSDGKFGINGVWERESVSFGYDFWYQPRFDVMISSEWGAPSAFKNGFDPDEVADGQYGHSLNVFKWSTGELVQKIDLGPEGNLPLEIRFLHDPSKSEGYVGCALSSSIFHFSQTTDGHWNALKVIQVEPKAVYNWCLPFMPGVITDILISMDDRYLYFSNWVQGDIRQYEIKSDPTNPKLVGQLFVGGSLFKGSDAKLSSGSDDELQEPTIIKGTRVRGGPQMLQLSLDGKRLYVTTSLFSAWDKQFYPELVSRGAMMLLINVNTERGGLRLDPNFLVDFGKEPNGPVLAHEMRYPGGDCTSDIFL